MSIKPLKSITVSLVTSFLIVACQPTTSSKSEINSAILIVKSSPINENRLKISSIRNVDFRNFTYNWTKKFGGVEKSFTLKNGKADAHDGQTLSLKNLSYVDVTEDDEQALVVIQIDDGNATYDMLYVSAIENGNPKILESFEFGDDNIYFATAFAAHGELVIERYIQKSGDAECCPSIIEISYYKWQKDKFVRQGDP